MKNQQESKLECDQENHDLETKWNTSFRQLPEQLHPALHHYSSHHNQHKEPDHQYTDLLFYQNKNTLRNASDFFLYGYKKYNIFRLFYKNDFLRNLNQLSLCHPE